MTHRGEPSENEKRDWSGFKLYWRNTLDLWIFIGLILVVGIICFSIFA